MFTVGVAGGSGTLSSITHTTVNSGPADVAVLANWSTGTLPTTSDVVWFTNSAAPASYNLQAFSGVVFASLNIDSTYTGLIGLPRNNGNGYVEYRQRYLQHATTVVNILPGLGAGSGQLQLDAGSAVLTMTGFASNSSAQQGLPALILRGTGANVYEFTTGNIGIAIEPGDTAAPASITVGYLTSQATDVTLLLGSGCTLSSTTINQNGGQLTASSTIAQLTQEGGSMTLNLAAGLTLYDVEGGKLISQASGTLTAGTIGIGGTLDLTTNAQKLTMTNATITGTFNDPNKVSTWTNPLSFPNGVGGQSGAQVNLGSPLHLART